VVDGAQELSRPAWAWLRRRSRAAAGLVVTSHRPGLLPTLVECTTDPVLLGELIRQLVAEGRPEDPPPEALHRRHRGNLRLALRELYDLYAGR
jgi:hypothetical protein